jgi:arylsulfatase A-like enzyme
MGYSDMGWQGSPIQTPNLDKLREGGMFLERCYAQPQCSPSRAALLTGRYPYRSGFHEHIILPWSFTGLPGPMSSITVPKTASIDEKELSFPEDAKSIAQKLKEGGYKTAIIGKWHLGSHFQSYLPHNQGFDYSFVAIEGEISYWNYTHYGRSNIISNGKKFYAKSMEDNETSGNTYATDLWAEKAVEVIRHHDPKHPLFMYLPITAPHWPLQAPQKFLDKYPLESIPDYWAGANATNKRTAENRRIYMAMVDAMDASIGTIIQSLKDQGMLDNTLIIFASDNGGIPESDNRPFRSVKGDSFEGGVRVPCIVFWPQKIKPGSTSSELVHIADWYPTLAEIAGLKVDEKLLDGMSVTSLLEGGAGLRKEVPIVSEGRHALITPAYSLVGGGSNYQELLSQNLSKFQMYDLNADSSQKKPTSDYPEIAKAMRDSMKEHFEQVHRGYFNWDVTHNTERLEKIKSDHAYDSVVNDLPQLSVTENAGMTSITISPVSEELTYHLQKSVDGLSWIDIASHVAKSDAKEYTFPPFPAPKERIQYRVKTERHMGLPMREVFADLKPGSAFISRNDKTGNVGIAQESLVFRNWPSEAGSLQLSVDKTTPLASLTLYSIEPNSRGKIYTAMLLKLEAKEKSAFGEINYLQMNGLKDTTKAATLTLQADGIYLDSASAVPRQNQSKIAPYDGGVVCIVLEFDFGTTNEDTLKIYVNPNTYQLAEPVAQIKGEFTFDRLQFQLSAQNVNAQMRIDELRIGRSWEELRTP